MPGKKGRRGWGAVRKLPSGRYQASYVGPDLKRYAAPITYTDKMTAEAWLAARRREIELETWRSPSARAVAAPLTFAAYADRWLATRLVKGEPLRPRTKALYRRLLDNHIVPTFGEAALRDIDREAVSSWYASLDPARLTQRAHVYSLLSTIMATAVAEELVTINPCQIRGAGSVERARKIEPATPEEVDAIVKHMPADRAPLVLFAAWCGLRLGEVTELRRGDVNLEAGTVRISRGVTWVDGKPHVGPPKTDAGLRTVAIPPHVLPAIKRHLTIVGKAKGALLFANADGSHLTGSQVYDSYHPARASVGRDDLRFHDLRHTSAVAAARAGATVGELQARLGHSTATMAMRYQHAAQGRDRAIADRMSEDAKPKKVKGKKSKEGKA